MLIQSNMNKIDRELGFSDTASASEFLSGEHQVKDLETEKGRAGFLQNQENKVECGEFQDFLDKKASTSSDFQNSVTPSDDYGEVLKFEEDIKEDYLKYLDSYKVRGQNFVLGNNKGVSLSSVHDDIENLNLHVDKHHSVKTDLLGLDSVEKDVNCDFGILDKDKGIDNDEISVSTDGVESYLTLVLDIPNDYKINEQFSLHSGNIFEKNDEGIPLKMMTEPQHVFTEVEEVEIDVKVAIENPNFFTENTENSIRVNQEFAEDFVDYKESVTDADVNFFKVNEQRHTEGSFITVSDQRQFSEVLSGDKVIPHSIGAIRNALTTTGNVDIVRKVQFVLKNENEGEIRLLLRPESLGVVHMKLNLNDGLVSGRIFVGNSYVQAAFEENMTDLRDAMEHAGFMVGDVEVSVDQNYNKHGSRENKNTDWDFDRISLSQGYKNRDLNFNYIENNGERLSSVNSGIINLRA